MFRVLVSDKMSEDGLSPLLQSEEITCIQKNVNEATDLESYDALLIRSATTVTEELLAKMPNLKIIARAGVGVDNIDLDAATKRGVIVVNAPSGNTISTAEHSFAMMMALARKICQANNSIKNGEWNRGAFQGMELLGKSLGIVGFGRIGQEIAKRAKGFEMDVLAFDPFLTPERANKVGVKQVDLEYLLAHADIITVHTPLTKETQGLLNMESFKLTKPGVLIVNCARGGIIDEEALKHYIENGHVGGAALDVFEEEPTHNKELLALDRVIATPHIAASTGEAQLNVAVIVSEEVLNFAQGKPVRNGINIPAIPTKVLEKIKPYYDLTKTMGAFISKLAKGSVKEFELVYSGEITKLETSLATRAFIAGFLQPKVDWIINDVNAPAIAKDYGITYGEKHCDNGSPYANSVKVIVTSSNNERVTLEGTHIREFGPRIVNIDGFDVDFSPHGHVLVIDHLDKPGVIGNLGQLLGAHDVNIASMQVGRKQIGGAALMILNVDKSPTDEVLQKVTEIPEIIAIESIEF